MGITESVGSINDKHDTSKSGTSHNGHLGFDRMPELDMFVEKDTKRPLDTKSVGSSDGRNDLFRERSAVGLVIELLSAVSG